MGLGVGVWYFVAGAASERRTASSVALPPQAETGAPGQQQAMPGAGEAVEPPAPPPDLGIKPAPLTADKVRVKLPDPMRRACLGRGGRYLILHLPAQRQLAIFDSNAAQVVKSFPAPEPEAAFAAGLDKLFVSLPGAKTLQRWDLSKLEPEAWADAPGPIKDLAMGSASRGPLIAEGAGGDPRASTLLCLDPETLRPGGPRFEATGALGGPADLGRQDDALRVSGDGRVVSRNGIYVRRGRAYVRVAAPTNALPGPDDRYLFTTGQLYTAAGQKVGAAVGRHGEMSWFIPAAHGPFYLSYDELGKPGDWDANFALRVRRVGEDTKPVLTVPNVAGLGKLLQYPSGQHPPYDQHFFLIPDAKLLIVIPASNDELVLYRVELPAGAGEAKE